MYVIPKFEHLQPIILFQQDGVPPNSTSSVREIFNRVLPKRWIRREGFIPCPPRSSDINPLDFFLRGYVIGIVYQAFVSDTSVLMKRTELAILTVTHEM